MRRALFIRATTPLLILAVILWSAFWFVPQAHAATITFTSCPTGTVLHNAVNSASPGDTIQFRISGSPCTIDLSGAGGGTLFITKNLTFDASGSPQPVTLSGGQSVQVLQVSSRNTFTLLKIIIANGVSGNGGGIYNGGGTLTISNSTISNNSANSGGGIYNGGTMNISNSIISSNTGPSSGYYDDGGGIYNGGTMNISNSTIANNSITFGGGIFNGFGGKVSISQSTVANNSAASDGGGIYNGDNVTMTISQSTVANNSSASHGGIWNAGPMTISNSTIANNSATNGSGGLVNSFNATVTISNSTIANNSAPSGGIDNLSGTVSIAQSIVANNRSSNCAGPITDQGYNLESGTNCSFGGATDRQNTNPQFQGGLQNNGGPTQTIALQPSSPAVDKIPVNTGHGCIAGGTDQRGRLRPDHDLLLLPESTCDIGAYEVQDLL